MDSVIPASDMVVDPLYDKGRVAIERAVTNHDLNTAAQAFESYFLAYLMKTMRQTVPKGGLLSNRMGEIFYSFLDQEIGKRAAEVGGIGLSDMILSALAEDFAGGTESLPR